MGCYPTAGAQTGDEPREARCAASEDSEALRAMGWCDGAVGNDSQFDLSSFRGWGLGLSERHGIL